MSKTTSTNTPECGYITLRTEMTDPNDGAEKRFAISYIWITSTIVFTCLDEPKINGEFKLDRPFASRTPADFLLTNEVSNYLDHTPEEREKYYATA